MSSSSGEVVLHVDGSINLSPVDNVSRSNIDSSVPDVKVQDRHLPVSNMTPDTPVSSCSHDYYEGRTGTPRCNSSVQIVTGSRESLIRRLNSAPLPGCSLQGNEGNKENSRIWILSPLRRELSPHPLTSTSFKTKSSFETCETSPLRPKTPLECHDWNSQDSGYSQEDGYSESSPQGSKTIKLSPCARKIPEFASPSSRFRSGSLFKPYSDGKVSGSLGFGSSESVYDGFLELGELDRAPADEKSMRYPSGMDNLLKGQLLNLNDTIPVDDSRETESDEEILKLGRRPLRRVNSALENYNSPMSSKFGIGLFRDDTSSPGELSPFDKVPFKRPRETETNFVKRRKYSSYGFSEKSAEESVNPRYKLQRSISETAACSLASAMHKTDLIADFSRPYALPVISGRHEDLKSISAETLADLINGRYSNSIESFRIIDCRYPYEYEGGHIKGSTNLYTQEQVQRELLGSVSYPSSPKETPADRRSILIFHCEFSLERGPALYRFLRKCDRSISSYPSLQYPEVYLLHGGYKNFFSSHQSLCEPCSYQPMVDPKHEGDLRKFRFKSNSYGGDGKRYADRTGMKRLGLF